MSNANRLLIVASISMIILCFGYGCSNSTGVQFPESENPVLALVQDTSSTEHALWGFWNVAVNLAT